MRRATGDAVSKPALIEVPGFGASIKAGLEVSVSCVVHRTRRCTAFAAVGARFLQVTAEH